MNKVVDTGKEANWLLYTRNHRNALWWKEAPDTTTFWQFLALLNGKETDHCIRKPIATASKRSQQLMRKHASKSPICRPFACGKPPFSIATHGVTERRHLAVHLWPGLGWFSWLCHWIISNWNAIKSSTKNSGDRSIDTFSMKNRSLNNQMK